MIGCERGIVIKRPSFIYYMVLTSEIPILIILSCSQKAGCCFWVGSANKAANYPPRLCRLEEVEQYLVRAFYKALSAELLLSSCSRHIV